jgi:hypothetical protein
MKQAAARREVVLTALLYPAPLPAKRRYAFAQCTVPGTAVHIVLVRKMTTFVHEYTAGLVSGKSAILLSFMRV